MIGNVRSNLPSWLGGSKGAEGTEPAKEGDGEKPADGEVAKAEATTTAKKEETTAATAVADTANQVRQGVAEEQIDEAGAAAAGDENKAMFKVKNFGMSIFSSVKEAGTKIGNVKTIIQDLTESTGAKFKKSKLPWEGHENEEKLKEEILSLSSDRRNFVRAPPAGVNFDYNADKYGPIALALLEKDEQLGKMRFDLVPKLITEDAFWKNYFYRVQLLQEQFDAPPKVKGNESSDEEAELCDDDADLEKELNEYEIVEEKNMENVEKEIQEILDLK